MAAPDPKDTRTADAKTQAKEQDLTVSGDRDSTPARGKAAAQEERARARDEPTDTRPLREDLPTNDEPVIPFTAFAEEVHGSPVQMPPVTLQVAETVDAPRAVDPQHPARLRRLVTDEDMETPGFKALSSHAKESLETLILRPGDRVTGPMLVVGLHDINRQIELRPGAVVPDWDTGYVPVNYMLNSHQSQRLLQQEAERAAGNRG